MTVAELIRSLQDMDPEAPVRIASVGHRSAFEYAVRDQL